MSGRGLATKFAGQPRTDGRARVCGESKNVDGGVAGTLGAAKYSQAALPHGQTQTPPTSPPAPSREELTDQVLTVWLGIIRNEMGSKEASKKLLRIGEAMRLRSLRR